MDVDMRAFLSESLCYDSYTLNEASNNSDDKKFSDRINDILTPIIKKLNELFERFKNKFGAIINKILSKLGLNPIRDMKSFKDGLIELRRDAHIYHLPEVNILDYSYELVDNFRIIDKVVNIYNRAITDIKMYAKSSPSYRHMSRVGYTTVFGIGSHDYEFTWDNIDIWGGLMKEALTPLSQTRSMEFLFILPDTIYSPDNLDEVLRLGSSGYTKLINNKVSSIKSNINDILKDAKDELKSSVKDKETERDVFDKISKLASTIPPVVTAVTDAVMGAAAEVCRRAVTLANLINKINTNNGYGNVVNLDGKDDGVEDASTSFSKLMR